MKRIVLVSIGVMVPALASAHTSIVAHEHPHAMSLLPDLAALLMAAVAVGAGIIVVAMSKKAQK